MGSLLFVRSQIQPVLFPYLITKIDGEGQVEGTCQTHTGNTLWLSTELLVAIRSQEERVYFGNVIAQVEEYITVNLSSYASKML